jgi:hypothetical protein
MLMLCNGYAGKLGRVADIMMEKRPHADDYLAT